jgi:hypothetical protein
MDFAQKGFNHLKSGSSAILDIFYQRQLSQYWPLESRGNLYIPATHDDSTQPRKRTKCRIVAWTGLLLLTLAVLYFATNGLRSPKSPPGEIYDPGGVYGNTSPKHPLFKLVEDAEFRFKSVTARQSNNLAQAAAEYRRRYGMPPPPRFEEWYRFAVDSGVQLIDEYDSIHESLQLFWALKPADIRARTVEALGYSQSLMGVSIRNGQVQTVGEGQGDWQEPATRQMISEFSKWLPDMDLAFNVNDESRVLVPHEDVERMYQKAMDAIQSVKSSQAISTGPVILMMDRATNRCLRRGLIDSTISRHGLILACLVPLTHQRETLMAMDTIARQILSMVASSLSSISQLSPTYAWYRQCSIR